MLTSILSHQQHLDLLPCLNPLPEGFESHIAGLADASGLVVALPQAIMFGSILDAPISISNMGMGVKSLKTLSS